MDLKEFAKLAVGPKLQAGAIKAQWNRYKKMYNLVSRSDSNIAEAKKAIAHEQKGFKKVQRLGLTQRYLEHGFNKNPLKD